MRPLDAALVISDPTFNAVLRLQMLSLEFKYGSMVATAVMRFGRWHSAIGDGIQLDATTLFDPHLC